MRTFKVEIDSNQGTVLYGGSRHADERAASSTKCSDSGNGGCRWYSGIVKLWIFQPDKPWNVRSGNRGECGDTTWTRWAHYFFHQCSDTVTQEHWMVEPREACHRSIDASSVRIMMTSSSNGNIFRVTGPLCGEFTGPRWIPRTKASGTELWCFLRSALK